MKMKRGKTYYYEEVEGYGKHYGYGITEHGKKIVRGNVIILSKEIGHEVVLIFLLNRVTSNGNFYECVYANEPIGVIDS
jgi:hypothetical protein